MVEAIVSESRLPRTQSIHYSLPHQDRLHIDTEASTGSLNFKRGRPVLTTYSSGRVSRAKRDLVREAAATAPTWDAPRFIRWAIGLQPKPETAGDTAPPESITEAEQYFTTGNPEADVAGFGFKLPASSDPTITGVVHDGSTEHAVELDVPNEDEVPPSTGSVTFRCAYWPNQYVKFYINSRVAGKFDDESRLPRGQTDAETIWSAAVNNQTSADERRETVLDVQAIQKAP